MRDRLVKGKEMQSSGNEGALANHSAQRALGYCWHGPRSNANSHEETLHSCEVEKEEEG